MLHCPLRLHVRVKEGAYLDGWTHMSVLGASLVQHFPSCHVLIFEPRKCCPLVGLLGRTFPVMCHVACVFEVHVHESRA